MPEERERSYIPVEDLLGRVDSRYKLVILAARRAVELSEGGQRRVDISPKAKASTIALEEIRKGKISYKSQEEKKAKMGK